MGFGDLDLNDLDESDFLSESSILEEDFESLKLDDFLVTSPDASVPMPSYDPSKKYDDCFYSVLVQNQSLIDQIEKTGEEKATVISKIARIQEYYVNNLHNFKPQRYGPGQRKIHVRKTTAELDRDFNCPFEPCSRVYASEGALNLHIKTKHNGGNKTEREKLAQDLVLCHSKGMKIPETLSINLPLGMVKEKAEIIKKCNNIDIDITDLEGKLKENNKVQESMIKRQDLIKAEMESKLMNIISQKNNTRKI